MIITRELLRNITCEEARAWADEHPEIYGLNRKQFRKYIRDMEKAGLTPNKWWADWTDTELLKGNTLVHAGKLKRLGIYRIVAPGLAPQEFDDIDDAVATLEVAKNTQIETEAPYFHIQVRQRHGASGYDILSVCDTAQDTCVAPTPAAYFSTFNINTGAYEDFLTYGQAKNRMIELRNARRDLVADSYAIEEKIQEVGSADGLAPADFVIVQTVKGRKTEYKDRLDRVERRPDPKPRKPKP